MKKKIVETNNGKKGGLFKGKRHSEGGIKGIVTDTNNPIEVEQGEIIITRKAAKEHCETLSEINQSGGGVAIPCERMDGNGDVFNEGGSINGEYRYGSLLRPLSIGTYPKDNFLRLEKDENFPFGIAVYSDSLPLEKISHFSFFPITELITYVGKSVYYYENYKADVTTDNKSIILSKDIGGEETEIESMTPVDFLKKVDEGEYKLAEFNLGGNIVSDGGIYGNPFLKAIFGI